jgi:hypothetical protein
MHRCSLFLCSMFLLLSTSTDMATADEMARKPSYPLFAILQVQPGSKKSSAALAGPEAFAPLCQYQMIYTSDGSPLRMIRDARKTIDCKVPVLVYMGGFTTNPGGATEIEKGYRAAVAMIDVTALAAAVDASASQVQVGIPQDGELPIQASTANLTDPRDNAKYCFWIRIDDELMKVLAVDTKSGVLRVQRGFESKAAAHAAGATVLAPVYLGNRQQLDAVRHTNSWPGGPDYLRYALDPQSEAAQRFKAELIVDLMKSGYDGAWLDTFQPVPYNLCDALGRKVPYYWDFHGQRRYDFDSYLAALQQFLGGVRQKIKESVGREPVLAANSISGSYAQGGKKLLAGPDRPALLDGGYCFEDSYISPRGSRGKRGMLQATFNPAKPDLWLRNVENQADAARDGLRALCMMGPAGYVAAYINPSLENYEQLLRFSWCSFLLTVTQQRTTQFGLPLLITERESKVEFLPLSEMFYAPIGDPLDANDIGKLKLPNSPCYLRKFTGALVVVNPSGLGNAAVVDIPSGYVDWQSKQPISQVSLPPGDACLLLTRSAATLPNPSPIRPNALPASPTKTLRK